MSRCTGHCCKRFYLPVTPTQLQGEAELIRLGGRSRFGPTKDVLMIADMVIHLETREHKGETLGVYRDSDNWYTCKHFNEESGNCMNYENRPDMCRNYPYGRACTFKECTYKPEELINPDCLKRNSKAA